jgi:thioredoxin-related protein
MRVPRFAVPLLAALLFLPAAGSGLPGGDPSPGHSIRWKPYGAALADARLSGRKVVVDVYTSWCGWCKRMDRDTYSRADVASLLAKKFEAVRLDAESSVQHSVQGESRTERRIATDFGVTGYPTTVFLTSTGEFIAAIPGYLGAEKFIDVLTYIGDDRYKTESWDAFLQSRTQR